MNDNWMIVRVWLQRNVDGVLEKSIYTNSNPNGASHASIETPNAYASYYSQFSQTFRSYYFESEAENAVGIYVSKLKDDKTLLNNREPDVVVVLYDMKVQDVESAINKFQTPAKDFIWHSENGDCTLKIFKDIGFFNSIHRAGGANHIYDLLNVAGAKRYAVWDKTTENSLNASADSIAKMALYLAATKYQSNLSNKYPLPAGINQRILRPDSSEATEILDPTGVSWVFEAPGQNCLLM